MTILVKGKSIFRKEYFYLCLSTDLYVYLLIYVLMQNHKKRQPTTWHREEIKESILVPNFI